MTAAAFDLGRRLRAARDGQPVPTSRSAPALPPTSPIAVDLHAEGRRIVATASDGVTTAQAYEEDIIDVLESLGVVLTLTYRTLIVPNRSTLHTLEELARAKARDHRGNETAAVLGWWADRAEHPGSGAVLILQETLPARWTLGVHPDRERDLTVWARWLGVTTTGTEMLLDLAAAVTASPTRDGLLTAHSRDDASWQWLEKRRQSWHLPDSRAQAALGLISRCDAAELYESIALDDSLVAHRASFSGEVITGTVTATQPLTIRADRLAIRLRQGAHVDTWPGEAWQPATTTLRGRITDSTVNIAGELHLTIGETSRLRVPAVGERLTLRPRRVNPHQQGAALRRRRRRHNAAQNWLATRNCPPPLRRNVPLDIAIATADD